MIDEFKGIKSIDELEAEFVSVCCLFEQECLCSEVYLVMIKLVEQKYNLLIEKKFGVKWLKK